MKVIKLLPYGFCYGVYNAYQKTLEILKQNTDKKIYILGWLVHNKNIIDELIQLKANILDDKNQSRYDLINAIEDDTIVILSAHGTDYNVFDLMKKKRITYYDLTCKYVYKTHDLIKEKLNDNYSIIFIGKKNHPETNAIMSLSNKIILVESIEDINKIQLNNHKIFCTNQTTLGLNDYALIVEALKNKFNDIEIINDICDATTLRQKAIMKADNKDIDICIVIGDERSSNCNELYKLAKNKFNEAYMINNISKLNLEWFKNKKVCAITAGASTPNYLIDKIIKKIEEI